MKGASPLLAVRGLKTCLPVTTAVARRKVIGAVGAVGGTDFAVGREGGSS